MNVQKDVQLTILVRKSLSGARTERLVSASKEQKVVPTTDLSVTNIPTSAKRSLSGAGMEPNALAMKEQKAVLITDLSVTNLNPAKKSLYGAGMERVVCASQEQKAVPTTDLSAMMIVKALSFINVTMKIIQF